VVAIAALAFAVAGCGGSASTTSTTGPSTADVNAACQAAIGARVSIAPKAPFWREFQSDRVQYKKIAAVAQAAGVDSDLVQVMDALDQNLAQLIPATRSRERNATGSRERNGLTPKERRAIGLAAEHAGHEADQVEKQLADAGFKACAGLLPL
jgi:hypothetical protein